MRQNLFDELPCPRKTQTEPIFSIDCFDGKPKEHKKYCNASNSSKEIQTSLNRESQENESSPTLN